LSGIKKLVSDISEAIAADNDKYLNGLSHLIVGDDANVTRFMVALRDLLELTNKTEEELSI